MTEDEFIAVAEETWNTLPEEFRAAVCNLVTQVVDRADPDTLRALDIDHPMGLLGLYHGIGLPFKSVLQTGDGPDMIFLYRLPILNYAHQTGDQVEAVIRHVYIHEIGHHFGFSDDDMEAIEQEADAE
jgi:predicted Zn-dependent protease with MMP-like domain